MIMILAISYLNWTSLVIFFIGFTLGITICFLVYIYVVLLLLERKKRKKLKSKINVDEQETKLIIIQALTTFKTNKKERKEHTMGYAFNICKELIYDISSKFYPNSDRPYLELTLDETLKLTKYISDRIDELLKPKLLSVFRQKTLNQLDKYRLISSKVMNNKLIKEDAINGYSIATSLNPLSWITRHTFGYVKNFIYYKICEKIIIITGEETYHIYSKKVFINDNEKEFESILNNNQKLYENEE